MVDSQSTRTTRSESLDALKGIAILSVLLLHALPRDLLYESYAWFHIWQAVPLLLVLMGYTGALTRIRPLGGYFRRRAARLLLPLAVIWGLSLGIALLKGEFTWNPLFLIGVLPAGGPGNYFVTLAIEFTLILPLLRILQSRSPWLLLVACFVVDLAFELLAGRLGWEGYLYSSSVLRTVFAIALGMLIASGHRVWPLLPISLAYLVAVARGTVIPFLVEPWQAQSLFAAGYPAALIGWGVRRPFPAWLAGAGRASWHVFLVQMLWFGQLAPITLHRLGLPVPLAVMADVVVCLGLGAGFFSIERLALRRWTVSGVARQA